MFNLCSVTQYLNSVVQPQSAEEKLLRKRSVFVISSSLLTTASLTTLGLYATLKLALVAGVVVLAAEGICFLLSSDSSQHLDNYLRLPHQQQAAQSYQEYLATIPVLDEKHYSVTSFMKRLFWS